jgi:hypothetical protein
VIDAAEKVAYYILLVFCLSPAVPISISWVRQFWKKDKFQSLQLFFLAIVISSFAWSIIGYLLRTPSSESLRNSVVGYPGWNGSLMIVIALLSGMKGRKTSSVTIAAAATALVWIYISLINAAPP